MKPDRPWLFKLTAVACTGIVWMLIAATVSADDRDSLKEAVLTAIENRYAGNSFEASFTQTSRLDALDMIEQASGKAVFSHPGKMRWEYLKPENHEIITNGKTLWIHRPEENQVMTGEADELFRTGAGGAFLSDISLVRKNYLITVRMRTEAFTELDLTARQENPDISLIVIRVLNATGDIDRVMTRNAHGDTNLFEFSDIRFGPVDPSIFEFTVPDGANVVEMNR